MSRMMSVLPITKSSEDMDNCTRNLYAIDTDAVPAGKTSDRVVKYVSSATFVKRHFLLYALATERDGRQ
eukprot:1876463-Amphidinium_carterae.1